MLPTFRGMLDSVELWFAEASLVRYRVCPCLFVHAGFKLRHRSIRLSRYHAPPFVPSQTPPHCSTPQQVLRNSSSQRANSRRHSLNDLRLAYSAVSSHRFRILWSLRLATLLHLPKLSTLNVHNVDLCALYVLHKACATSSLPVDVSTSQGQVLSAL